MSTDKRRYKVLVNDEGQHALFPDRREVPLGWSVVGQGLSRLEAQQYVDEHWKDITPASARRLG
jgi:uncharacterized protein YbdZ (MbtH family)